MSACPGDRRASAGPRAGCRPQVPAPGPLGLRAGFKERGSQLGEFLPRPAGLARGLACKPALAFDTFHSWTTPDRHRYIVHRRRSLRR